MPILPTPEERIPETLAADSFAEPTRDPVQPILQAAVYVLLCVAPVWLFGWLFLFAFNILAGSVLAVVCAALLGNFFCLRTFDGVGLERVGMPLNRMGLRNSLTGLALGCAAAAIVIALPLWTGHAHEIAAKGPPTNWREQLFVPAMLLAGAAGEEILFRGFGFQVLLRAFGPFSALLPIGALFGFMHGANPHSSIYSIANTMGFGVLFGYAFVRSHDIWLPFGLHFGWNLTLLLFGANISGITMRVTPYEVAWENSAIWSGAEYGPEASLVTTCVLVLAGLALWKVKVARQHAYLVDGPRRIE